MFPNREEAALRVSYGSADATSTAAAGASSMAAGARPASDAGGMGRCFDDSRSESSSFLVRTYHAPAAAMDARPSTSSTAPTMMNTSDEDVAGGGVGGCAGGSGGGAPLPLPAGAKGGNGTGGGESGLGG